MGAAEQQLCQPACFDVSCIRRPACRMLFGWKAADQLKTQTLSYTPTTSQWKRYFDT